MENELEQQWQRLTAEWRQSKTLAEILPLLWRMQRVEKAAMIVAPNSQKWFYRLSNNKAGLRAYMTDGVDIRAYIPAKDEN